MANNDNANADVVAQDANVDVSAPETPAPVDAAPQAPVEPQDGPAWLAVQDWINNHLTNSPLSQFTPAFNCFSEALPALRGVLNAL